MACCSGDSLKALDDCPVFLGGVAALGKHEGWVGRGPLGKPMAARGLARTKSLDNRTDLKGFAF